MFLHNDNKIKKNNKKNSDDYFFLLQNGKTWNGQMSSRYVLRKFYTKIIVI